MKSITLLLLSACALWAGPSATCLAAQLPSKQALPPTTGNPNDPGIVEPTLSRMLGYDYRIPNSHQVSAFSDLLNIVGTVKRRSAKGKKNAKGNTIQTVSSPNQDLHDAMDALVDAARDGKVVEMRGAATAVMDILLGRTTGRIYDGYAMLNFNQGAVGPAHVPGEYKMKRLRDSGQTFLGPDGLPRRIWEVTVNLIWYDGESDSDTHFLVVPETADPLDALRVHYRIFSSVREDFAPATLLEGYRPDEGVVVPLKGLDSTWVAVQSDQIVEVSVDHPPVSMVQGVLTWGWRTKPIRTQYIRLVRETRNAHTGALELEPEGLSASARCRMLGIEEIGDAAPEKKMYQVAQAALGGTPAAQVYAMATTPGIAPFGEWDDWTRMAERKDELPIEAWAILAQEGIYPGAQGPRPLGPYDAVLVYVNNEIYALDADPELPPGKILPELEPRWDQGQTIEVKLINLDDHTHYYRNYQVGPELHNDIETCEYAPAGGHSIEIFNHKPVFGGAKEEELQWRAGWGLMPYRDVELQDDLFFLPFDGGLLTPFRNGAGESLLGWQYPPALRGGDFVFDPPRTLLGEPGEPAAGPLRESDGSRGLVIGTTTPGYGSAKLCDHIGHPIGDWCRTDRSPFHPQARKNVDLNGDKIPDVLWFPPHLRNPDPAGGDLILSNPDWEPFLYLNPDNGTIWIDPMDQNQGYWVDRSYVHGMPLQPGEATHASILVPRSAAQVYFQFDGVFADDAVAALGWRHEDVFGER